MPRSAFPYTTFTDPSGNAIINGYVLIRVSQDVKGPDGLICGGMELRVQLDGSGVMVSVPQVWPNASLNPLGSSYIYRAFEADGQLALGPEAVVV